MSEEIKYRKAVTSDLPYVYEICLKTGDSGKDATHLFNDPYMMGHYYAAPYLIYPHSICFVAEFQHRPQGYIICAQHTIAFNKWMEEVWLPPLRELYSQPFPKELIRSKKESEILKEIHRNHYPVEKDYQNFISGYPAHLHIDILPNLQGKGVGRTLMDKLFTELKQQGVPGLHLGVSNSNQGAVAFYNKTGFTVLKEHDWGFTMGKTV